MAEWPPHMLNILHGTKDTHSAMGDGWREGFTKEILDDKKAWPFWRIKLLQFKCVLESQTGKRYTPITKVYPEQCWRSSVPARIRGDRAFAQRPAGRNRMDHGRTRDWRRPNA